MYSPWSNLKPPSFMTLVTGTTAPLEAIMVAVPTSKTCRMSGALPARNAAMAAVIDSSYWPLYVGTILYWVWLALYSLARDRKSTRLNSSHLVISYAVFCLKKKQREGSRTVIFLLLNE